MDRDAHDVPIPCIERQADVGWRDTPCRLTHHFDGRFEPRDLRAERDRIVRSPRRYQSVSLVCGVMTFAFRVSSSIKETQAKLDSANDDRHRRHLDFLREASTGEGATITPRTASQAREAWQLIRDCTANRMPVPAAMTGDDGRVFYSWDRGRHHMELEIAPGEPAFFFYRDRETGETWSEEGAIAYGLTTDASARLLLFI